MSNRAGPKADVLQGTLDLYPALMRLEQRGLLRGKWGPTETHRKARFYSVTSAGRRQLAREKDAWDRMSGVIHTVLRGEA